MKNPFLKFPRPPSVFSVAIATVFVYWLLIISLGYRYYHLSGDWLKESAEFLLLSSQSIGIVIGAYWVMRTFGWEPKIKGVSLARKAIRTFVNHYTDIYGAYIVKDGGPEDFFDFLRAVWSAQQDCYQALDQCVIPTNLRERITTAIHESTWTTVDLVEKNHIDTVRVLGELLQELDAMHDL